MAPCLLVSQTQIEPRIGIRDVIQYKSKPVDVAPQGEFDKQVRSLVVCVFLDYLHHVLPQIIECRHGMLLQYTIGQKNPDALKRTKRNMAMRFAEELVNAKKCVYIEKSFTMNDAQDEPQGPEQTSKETYPQAMRLRAASRLQWSVHVSKSKR